MFTVQDCEHLRRQLKSQAEKAWSHIDEVRRSNLATKSEHEALDNMILAYRHLEDASMRLGKCIQALDGGASVYDKTQVPGA